MSRAFGVDEPAAREKAITSGTIAAQPVVCLSGEVQLLFRAGFAARRFDDFDVGLLLRHLGSPRPFTGDEGRARRAAASVLFSSTQRTGARLRTGDLARRLPDWLGETER